MHNYLMKKCTQSNENHCNYCPRMYIDRDNRLRKTLGDWHKEHGNTAGLQEIPQIDSNNYWRDANK